MILHLWGSRPRFFFSFIVLLVMAGIFLAACAPDVIPAQDQGPRDDCGLIEPTQDDIDKILSFGGDLFKSENWVRSYSVEPYKITLTRHNEVDLAVTYIEYLVYTCGYGQPELDEYFNDEGFSIVFQGYESYNLASFCEAPDLALYEFDLVDEDADYISHYWVEQTDDTHVLVVMLVFPKESTAQLDEYSKRLFPALTSCP
jgi:hypothetical protein